MALNTMVDELLFRSYATQFSTPIITASYQGSEMYRKCTHECFVIHKGGIGIGTVMFVPMFHDENHHEPQIWSERHT